ARTSRSNGKASRLPERSMTCWCANPRRPRLPMWLRGRHCPHRVPARRHPRKSTRLPERISEMGFAPARRAIHHPPEPQPVATANRWRLLRSVRLAGGSRFRSLNKRPRHGVRPRGEMMTFRVLAVLTILAATAAADDKPVTNRRKIETPKPTKVQAVTIPPDAVQIDPNNYR